MMHTTGDSTRNPQHLLALKPSDIQKGEYLLGVGKWHFAHQRTRHSLAKLLQSGGIGDITGPVVETNMMGYASLAQTNIGLHMR
jgi:hypothetical protein